MAGHVAKQADGHDRKGIKNDLDKFNFDKIKTAS